MYTYYTYTRPNIVAWKLQKFNVLRVRIRLTIIMSNYIWNQIYFPLEWVWGVFESFYWKQKPEWVEIAWNGSVVECLGILNVCSDVNVCRILDFLVCLILTCSLDEIKNWSNARSHAGHIYFYMLINCRNKTKKYGNNKDGKTKKRNHAMDGSRPKGFCPPQLLIWQSHMTECM